MSTGTKKTERGFPFVQFKDYYGVDCTLQASSSLEPCVWLEITEPKPRILASEAHKLGICCDSDVGWVDYPIPKEVLIRSRMHLNKDMVKSLITKLINWLDTGELK